MNDALPDVPPALAGKLASLLEAHPHGIDEFSLIRLLAESFPDSLFAQPDALRDPLKMFRAHFLLFHTLYRLADEFAGQGLQLHISALRIALEPRSAAMPALALGDPLRSYYFDWRQWGDTREADVKRMLGDFFAGMCIPDAEVQAALGVLELSAPAEPGLVRRQYRRLVSLHHPDRGGDTETTQRINDAYLILKRYYRVN